MAIAMRTQVVPLMDMGREQYIVTASKPADWDTNYTAYYSKAGSTYTPVETADPAPAWTASTYYEKKYAEAWEVCGDGWKKFSENPNAQTESVKYINQVSQTTDTTEYNPQYSFECDLMYTEPTIKKVYDIAKNRKTGTEAVVTFLVVDTFDGDAENGYAASKENLAVAVAAIDGDKKMTLTGNLNGQGDGIKGKYTPGSSSDFGGGTFTPDN